ncbi:MAG: hypothetical protein BGO40_11560 [Chryseobacterium sp. 39-10]|nr:T9SS type A sorting domain-containing protein [Chryseobacterium sp.]OJV47474.1 MAG: hypothetical protein BGO40_11560 [Chryseobacterium sp. 39-10]
MKKNFYTLLALAATISLEAQVFNAGFENNNGTPFSSFKKINRDGKTVPVYAEIQDFNTEAWIQFYDGYDNKIAFSTSYYSPAGQSDDWLITPKIDVPNEGTPTLYWKGKSYDFDFMDSYAVKISESDDQADSFTSTLLQVNNEQPFDFASHTLDLSAYKGKSIYIAFVNNTNNGTYLALDDLYLSKSANCTMPDLNGFGVVNLKPTSFSINWSSTEGISQYDTGLTTFDTSVASTGIATGTAKDFSGLQAGKRYQFFLKNADCGSGWAGPKSIWTPSTLPYEYDFEKTVENFGEYDSDGWSSFSWINGNNQNAANAGQGYAFNNTSTSSTKNDWLFSYPVYLESGETLNVNYFTAIGNADADPATLKVAVATAPKTSSIVSNLSTVVVSQSAYSEKTSQFTATTSGVYYVAFGNVTAPVAKTTALRLDSVHFTKEILAVAESAKNEVNVFPNPVQDVLQISSKADVVKVEVYALDGKLISSQKADKIDFTSVPKGLYLVKVTTKLGTKIEKVIKK